MCESHYSVWGYYYCGRSKGCHFHEGAPLLAEGYKGAMLFFRGTFTVWDTKVDIIYGLCLEAMIIVLILCRAAKEALLLHVALRGGGAENSAEMSSDHKKLSWRSGKEGREEKRK